MNFGTLGEGIVLWVLANIVCVVFVGYRNILILNIVVTILIMLGFFIGIGSHIFQIMFL